MWQKTMVQGGLFAFWLVNCLGGVSMRSKVEKAQEKGSQPNPKDAQPPGFHLKLSQI